ITNDRTAEIFGFRVSNLFRHSAFVLRRFANCSKPWRQQDSPILRDPAAIAHNMIVSPRAGPTLTMESFAPASSEMYLRYFLAAEGSCENLRAARKDVFQPETSS